MSLRRQLQDALRTGDVLDLESAIEGAKSALAANAANGSLDTSRSSAPRSMSGVAELERLILEAKHAFLKAMEQCKHLLKPLRRAVRDIDGPKIVEALAPVYRAPDAAQRTMTKDIRRAEKILELMSLASLGAEAMLTTKRWDEVDRYLNNFASILPHTVVLELTAVRDSLFHLTSPTRDHISPASTSPLDRMGTEGEGDPAASAQSTSAVRFPFSPPFSRAHGRSDAHEFEVNNNTWLSPVHRTTLPDDILELHRRLTIPIEWAGSERSSSAVQRSHRAADAFFAATLEATLSAEESLSRNHVAVLEKRERAQVYHVIFRENCVSDVSLCRIERHVFHRPTRGTSASAPTSLVVATAALITPAPRALGELLESSVKPLALSSDRTGSAEDNRGGTQTSAISTVAADHATPQSARSGSQSPVRGADGVAGARLALQQNCSSATSCSMSHDASRTSSPVPQQPPVATVPDAAPPILPPRENVFVASNVSAQRLPADVVSKVVHGEASGRRFLEESEEFARSTDLATKHSRLALAVQAAGGSSGGRQRMRVVLSPGELPPPPPPHAEGFRLGRWGMHQDPYAPTGVSTFRGDLRRVSPERVPAAHGTQRVAQGTYVSSTWQLHSPSPPSAMGDD